jgi:hypothetical protein
VHHESTPSPASLSTRKELLADRAEAELDRLRVAKPELESRIDRAAGILLLQLSSPPRSRPIRCRVGAMGPTFLVNSVTDRGGTYVINPRFFTCSCPDFSRRGKGCKHALAAFVLWRLAAEPSRPCACIDGWVYLTAETINQETGEMHEATTRVPCRRCSGPA